VPRPVISAEQRADDERYMARCLELARRFEGRTAPNPIVGCVIVDRWGKVLAEGAHARAGTPHAEIVAFANAAKEKAKLKGATLYVNLEPCNHQGRTGPCAPVVRDSGIERVVIGMEDPVPSHSGGIALLRRAKLEVHVGALREQCERANLAWTTFVREKRPAFTLKAAITLDGKIATVTGHSKYITGEAARADVMRLRDTHDAIMVGVGTVLADDPWLTTRGLPNGRDPIRIILDSKLRTPADAHVLANTARTIIVCGPDAPAKREKELVTVSGASSGSSSIASSSASGLASKPSSSRGASSNGRSSASGLSRASKTSSSGSSSSGSSSSGSSSSGSSRNTRAPGVEVWRIPVHANGRLDLRELAKRLADEDIISVLVEGGGEVHAYMIEKRLCDLVQLYIAPKVIGGPAPSWVGGKGFEHMASAVQFVFDEEIADFGGDLRLTGRLATVE
jgi:diaminohydroxyphosphoribosylaminopyrimidine deaminase/5-amino-6-(5-phosphoribosylamino)uracil reductase